MVVTKNEQTVTEAYSVDETVHIDRSAPVMPAERISPALTKATEIGSLCNNASMTRNENGEFVGQSTDVALLNVLDVFGIPDQRQVRAVLLIIYV
jgi:Ca2+-transporting ATPase